MNGEGNTDGTAPADVPESADTVVNAEKLTGSDVVPAASDAGDAVDASVDETPGQGAPVEEPVEPVEPVVAEDPPPEPPTNTEGGVTEPVNDTDGAVAQDIEVKDSAATEEGNAAEEGGDDSGVVFTTADEGMELKVPPKKKPGERMIDIGGSKGQKNQPVFHVSRERGNYSAEEIAKAADAYLKTGKINLTEIILVSEVIEELMARYIKFLEESEYLKANEVLESARGLRAQFRSRDTGAEWEQRIADLEDKKKDLTEAVKMKQHDWADKYRMFQDTCKEEIAMFEERTEQQRQNLAYEWSTPEKQRKYTKPSKKLRDGRSIEMCFAIAGELKLAEAQKRKNQVMIQRDTKVGYAEMTTAFETAQEKLERDIEQRERELKDAHKFRVDIMKLEEEEELLLLRRKLKLTVKMIAEDKRPDVQQRKRPGARTCELPMLMRTVENLGAKNRFWKETTEPKANPLVLPPLKVKARGKKAKKGDASDKGAKNEKAE